MVIPEPARSVLDLARWAPSADNTQPWRFEVFDGYRFAVHFHDTSDHCVYDLDGRISQTAWGALLENIVIAASAHGCRAVLAERADCDQATPIHDVTLEPDASVRPDPLAPEVTARSTQRRPLSTSPLTRVERDALEASVAPAFRVIWTERLGARLRMARLLSLNGKLRLVLPEAFEVHRSVIEWNSAASEDRIPDRAVGLDPLLLKVTRWAFGSWSRIEFLNRYLFGTVLARVELDYVPAILCAAHFALVAQAPLRSQADFIRGGRAVQRFWLTAEHLGLRFQPSVSPLVFARFEDDGRRYTSSTHAMTLARKVESELSEMLGGTAVRAATVFAGRLGHGPAPRARSTRLPLGRLLVGSGPH
jgi:hypothetical protein